MQTLTFPKGYGLGYGQKILKGSEVFKFPMLVVGANTYMRERCTPERLKNWDIFLLFFPTNQPIWQAGILGISRNDNQVFFEYAVSKSAKDAIDDCLADRDTSSIKLSPKAIQWLNLSVYRCPKIALRDVLSLESYDKVA
jgi:hypothetical protein